MLALSAVVLAPIILSHLGLGGGVDALVGTARWPALMALVVFGLTMLIGTAPASAIRSGPGFSPETSWLPLPG